MGHSAVFFGKHRRAGEELSRIRRGRERRGRGRRYALHVASRWTRDSAVIAVLVQAGADVNARDSTGETPLHRAVVEGRIPSVEALLAAGADANARDTNGATPLFGARSATIAALLEAERT